MFLAGLVLGKKIGWGGQARDDHSVSWGDAARQLWPHTLLGWSCILVLAFTVPSAIPYALFIAGGPALSIPLAVITSWPSVGRALMRAGIGALPEENAPPAPLRQLALPAIEAAALRAAYGHSGSREAAVRNP
jgi:membrane glycosyltransferase